MTVTSPNLSLILYDQNSPDNSTTFLAYRLQQAGTSTSSNMYLIDTEVGSLRTKITSLQNTRGAIYVPANYVSPNYYQALSVSNITSYITNMMIILTLNQTSNGTVTLDINNLGIKTLQKINQAGSAVNISGSELNVGRNYLFQYNGTAWIWVSATSMDQITTIGTEDNMVYMHGGALSDSNIASSDLLNALSVAQTGWIPASGTWTYASASTFTVAGDVSANFPVGSKIKLTQTTVKYFYVVSAAYSSPNTTITVTAGTSYTLSNAAITSPYYSYIASPQGFPQWFSWTPTWTSITTTGSPTYVGYFAIVGRLLSFSVQINPNGGTTACTYGTNYINNLPFTVAGNRGSDMTFNMDSGSFMGGAQHVATTKYLYPPTWTATGSTILINGAFQI